MLIIFGIELWGLFLGHDASNFLRHHRQLKFVLYQEIFMKRPWLFGGFSQVFLGKNVKVSQSLLGKLANFSVW